MILDRAIWLEERRKGIGATDIAAIAGVHPYKTPLQVYLEKVEATDEDLSAKPEVEWGLRLEEAIARKYADLHEVALEVTGLVVHPDVPWRRATPDRVVAGEARCVELKTAGIRQASRWGEEQTDEIPEEYLIQACWQIATLGFEACDIAVLIAGNDYREYRVHRDPDFEQDLVQLGEAFWVDHVKKGIPPALDSSEAARKYLLRKHPRNVAPLLQATPEAEALATRLREADERCKAAEDDKARARHELMALIGDHDGLLGEFGKIYWRHQAGGKSWKAIAMALNPSEELIQEHTRPGTRVFRPYWSKGV